MSVEKGSYRDVLSTPGVARIIIAQLVARFPSGMVSLAVLLHVERVTGSYGSAGLVLAATSIGAGIAGPITSRWMGKWGIRPVLITTMLVSAVAISLIAILEVPVPVYMLLALVAGLATPPVQSAVRTIYPKLVNSRQLTPLFSLDASLQEIIWVIAPVLITVISTQIGTTFGLFFVVVVLLIGCGWFISLPEVGHVRIPKSRGTIGKVLLRPPVALATLAGFLIIGACSAVEVGVVAQFAGPDGEHGLEAGIALAVFSVGSLIGGLASGALAMSSWSLARRFLLLALGLTSTVFSLSLFWTSTSLFIAGLGVAPVLALVFAVTTASVKFSQTAEAFGWTATGQLIGAAAGSAVAGFLVDGVGFQGAYIAAAAFAVLGCIVATVFVTKLPDLRHRDPSPLADTEPTPTMS